MDPNLFLDLFEIFSLAVISIFGFQAARAWMQYLKTRESQAINVTILCLSICIYALPTYIMLKYPNLRWMQVQSVHIYPLAGILGTWAYIRSINNYLGLPQSNLGKTKKIMLWTSLLPLYSIVHTLVYNEGFLFTWAAAGEEKLKIGIHYLDRIGALNKPNLVTALLLVLVIPMQLFVSYRFITYIIKNKPGEKTLIAGIIATFLLLVNETNVILKLHAWAIPTLFLSFSIESVRLSTALREKYNRRLADLENELTRISQVAELGFVAGSICHDLKNPLGIASGSSMRIKKMIDKKDIQVEKLSQIQESLSSSLDRIGKIADDYMAMMRNEVDDNYKNYKVTDLLEKAIELSKPKLDQYGLVKVETKVEPSLQVECLENQIVLALVNLISNACDAIKNIKDKWIKVVGENLDPYHLQIKVEDCGLGIPEDAVDKIFKSQFTTKKKGEGTGLGLDIVKRFVESHSGEIYVDKTTQHTCFVIQLPISQNRLNILEKKPVN